MGRRAKLNKERSISIAVSVKNWEFIKQRTTRGRKLDDFLTLILTDWSNITQLKEAAEFYSTEYDDALKSIKKYRQALEELLRLETIDNQVRFRINSVLGYDVGNLVEPSRGVAEQPPIESNNMPTNPPNLSEVIEKNDRPK